MDYIIREITNTDLDAIMEVEKQAFGYDKEARLVAQRKGTVNCCDELN